MQSYDVIIVGAGPAGLNCAKILSQSNKKVLLLEKNPVIGPKVCAGGLTRRDLKYLKLPAKILDGKFSHVLIHTPLQTSTMKLKRPFVWTVTRKNLGQWLLKKIKKNNVVIRTNATVTKINKSFIIVNNSEKVKYKYLVGADGASSVVRRYLGLQTKDFLVAMQYIIPTKKYKNMEFFFEPKLFSLGYAWIFAHKNYASIGCGSNPVWMPANKLRENFEKWLAVKKIDVSKAEFQAFTINYDYRGHKFGNIFLAGDAGGFASGYSGEGIHHALISGEEIAKMILDKDYVSQKINERIEKKKLHTKLLNFVDKSGPFKYLEYELFALLAKNRIFDEFLIRLLS